MRAPSSGVRFPSPLLLLLVRWPAIISVDRQARSDGGMADSCARHDAHSFRHSAPGLAATRRNVRPDRTRKTLIHGTASSRPWTPRPTFLRNWSAAAARRVGLAACCGDWRRSYAASRVAQTSPACRQVTPRAESQAPGSRGAAVHASVRRAASPGGLSDGTAAPGASSRCVPFRPGPRPTSLRHGSGGVTRMPTNRTRIYVMPHVREKPPSAPPTRPPTQRELVKASLLTRPSASRTNRA
jgi:hypothetical protein